MLTVYPATAYAPRTIHRSPQLMGLEARSWFLALGAFPPGGSKPPLPVARLRGRTITWFNNLGCTRLHHKA